MTSQSARGARGARGAQTAQTAAVSVSPTVPVGVPALTARAAISDGRGSTSVRDLPLSGAGEGSGWLKVESSAICGTDVTLNHGGLKRPAVLGHHVVGEVVAAPPALAQRLGVGVGDRIALEEYLGCNTCDECLAGHYRFCPRADLWGPGERVGMMPADVASGLHGGNAEYVELSDRHRAHLLPTALSVDLAAWTLPLANAIEWTLFQGGAHSGTRLAVIGPGYHGLACLAAARLVGAGETWAIGLTADAERLTLAAGLGARTLVSDRTPPLGEPWPDGLDVVVDTVGSPQTIDLGLDCLRRGGRLVLAGLARGEVTLGAVVRRLLEVRGVRGRSPNAVTASIDALASGDHGLSSIPTTRVALDEVGSTLAALRQGGGAASPHVVVDPWLARDPEHHEPRLQEATP